MGFIKFINNFNAHHRLYFSLSVSVIVYFLISNHFPLAIHVMLTWIAYAFCHLALAWTTILSVHPIEVHKIAKSQDASGTLIFIFVIIAALASLFAVVLLFQSSKSLTGPQVIWHVIFSITSVVCAWWLVHTIFTFRYAHLFYEGLEIIKNKKEFDGGLLFPKENEPDYLDFTYFSFVLGMTFQVSDVEISSRKIRRLAWVHGIISFLFNTVIVALSINIISTLISR